MKKLFLLFLVSGLFYGQLSPQVDKLYRKLSESQQYESRNIGVDGHESIPYKIHTEIGKIATEQELMYMALNGSPIVKNYISNILFSRKSKSIQEIFKAYLKTNDSIVVRSGCTGYHSFLADEIYRNVATEKYAINKAEEYKKWKDSLIHSKKEPDNVDFDFIMESLKVETQWKQMEIDSLHYQLDQIVLDNKESPRNSIELICSYYLYEKVRVPYYEKIAYFEKKYNSEDIKNYMSFCRNTINQ